MQPRLRTEIRAKAILRRAMSAGAGALVVRKGHEDAGALFVKVARLDGTADVYGAAPGPGTDESGTPRWSRPTGPNPVPEADAEAYLDRRRNVDPDIWVVEIEDREGRAFLDGDVEPDTPPEADPLIREVFRR